MTRSILDIRLLGHPADLPLIAPGVRGHVVPGAELRIPLIAAEVEGSGAVAAFLDELPTKKPIRFECVINPDLAAMLMRRGFVLVDVDSADYLRMPA